ncbi:MAG: hypothetical protein IPP51_03690 [Bacteroidetes bacterium]|nr:hypothetical protein [Bacteroidota bacterium]
MKLMKSIGLTLVITFTAVGLTLGQGATKSSCAKAATPAAKASDATPVTFEQAEANFHKVMSGTFHPVEDGNYEPIRARAAELATAANAWMKTPLSKVAETKNDKGEITSTLTLLAEKTEQLRLNISKGYQDDQIKTDLTEIHDIFHKIVERCQPGQEEK